MSLIELNINQEQASAALATFFLGEILRQLASYGTTLVEVQVPSGEELLSETCRQLGFAMHDEGFCFRKPAA